MHIQPQSDQLRKYIPQEVYFEMMDEQRNLSLIGLPLNQVDSSLIERRIQELKELEEKGFVHVGEKNWISSYQQNQSIDFQNYEQWVIQNFRNYLGLEFSISEDYVHLDHKLWEAEFDATELVLGYQDLKNPGFLDIDELEILIGGDEQRPSPAHIVKTFEFLHNLEYVISTIPADRSPRALSITGIDVSNPTDPCRWELGVISEYGGDFEKTIVNGLSWRSGKMP